MYGMRVLLRAGVCASAHMSSRVRVYTSTHTCVCYVQSSDIPTVSARLEEQVFSAARNVVK